MAELVDARDSKSRAARRAGSIPALGTTNTSAICNKALQTLINNGLRGFFTFGCFYKLMLISANLNIVLPKNPPPIPQLITSKIIISHN